MHSRLPDSAGISGYCVGAALAATLFVIAKMARPSKLDAIPTVGSTNWLGSWWAGFKFVSNAVDVLQEGYEKHKRAPFKVAEFCRWTVILSSQEHVAELSRAPRDRLSLVDAVDDNFQTDYTTSHELRHNPYHISVVRLQLTRSIGTLNPDMRDELVTAFDDVLDINGSEWKSVPAFRIIQQVVSRTTNRAFLGLPLCRDPDWIDVSIKFAQYIASGAVIVKLFPTFLKPLAVRLFTKIDQINERGRRLLGPVIKERQRWMSECGNKWADKPNDLLTWLIEEAEGPHSTVAVLTERVLFCNFVAIHTASTAFTNALFYLAANPQYIQPLREEVEAIVAKEGWSKVALSKMQKVDSFLKESGRMQGTTAASLQRKAVSDYTFSDGTFIPKGTMIAVNTRPIHYDEEFYPNAHVFEPFRFADLHGKDGEGTKHQLVSATTEYLEFGYGRHACPGRFFVANELKSMLAHVVVTYDVRFEDNAAPVQALHIGTFTVADPKAKVMFRRRIM